MSQAIPPSSAASSLPATSPALNVGAGVAGVATSAAAAGPMPTATVAATTATAATNPTAQVASIVAATQAALADTVNLSPQAQQAVKMQAFNQLVTNLVSQLQPASVALPNNWPAGGVTPQLQALVTQLLQQATASQPLPQQLVSVQSWPSVLTQAVLQHAGQNGAAPTAAPASGAMPSAASSPPSPLPALQNWLVQQGVVQAADGERAFTLTLRVPVAWAQAQAALSAALPKAADAGAPQSSASANAALPAGLTAAPLSGSPSLGNALQLPFTGSMQQLANGAMGLVMQPQVLPGSTAAAAAQAMRTSAILQLEFQPLAQATHSAQAASVYMPAHLMPQDVQAMLQGKGTDPWLLLAQAHANGQAHKQSKNSNEHNQNFCNRAGCQYQGRAICAQPFCAEMNYLWSADRAQRRTL